MLIKVAKGTEKYLTFAKLRLNYMRRQMSRTTRRHNQFAFKFPDGATMLIKQSPFGESIMIWGGEEPWGRLPLPGPLPPPDPIPDPGPIPVPGKDYPVLRMRFSLTRDAEKPSFDGSTPKTVYTPTSKDVVTVLIWLKKDTGGARETLLFHGNSKSLGTKRSKGEPYIIFGYDNSNYYVIDIYEKVFFDFFGTELSDATFVIETAGSRTKPTLYDHDVLGDEEPDPTLVTLSGYAEPVPYKVTFPYFEEYAMSFLLTRDESRDRSVPETVFNPESIIDLYLGSKDDLITKLSPDDIEIEIFTPEHRLIFTGHSFADPDFHVLAYSSLIENVVTGFEYDENTGYYVVTFNRNAFFKGLGRDLLSQSFIVLTDGQNTIETMYYRVYPGSKYTKEALLPLGSHGIPFPHDPAFFFKFTRDDGFIYFSGAEDSIQISIRMGDIILFEGISTNMTFDEAVPKLVNEFSFDDGVYLVRFDHGVMLDTFGVKYKDFKFHLETLGDKTLPNVHPRFYMEGCQPAQLIFKRYTEVKLPYFHPIKELNQFGLDTLQYLATMYSSVPFIAKLDIVDGQALGNFMFPMLGIVWRPSKDLLGWEGSYDIREVCGLGTIIAPWQFPAGVIPPTPPPSDIYDRIYIVHTEVILKISLSHCPERWRQIAVDLSSDFDFSQRINYIIPGGDLVNINFPINNGNAFAQNIGGKSFLLEGYLDWDQSSFTYKTGEWPVLPTQTATQVGSPSLDFARISFKPLPEE